jgi:uncharacterized protein YcfJ
MTMRTYRIAFVMAAAIGLSGCASLDNTQQRTLAGAAGGGALGGLVGSFSGNTALGAVLGAGVGGAGGYLYDRSQRQYEESPRRNDRRRWDQRRWDQRRDDQRRYRSY